MHTLPIKLAVHFLGYHTVDISILLHLTTTTVQQANINIQQNANSTKSTPLLTDG